MAEAAGNGGGDVIRLVVQLDEVELEQQAEAAQDKLNRKLEEKGRRQGRPAGGSAPAAEASSASSADDPPPAKDRGGAGGGRKTAGDAQGRTIAQHLSGVFQRIFGRDGLGGLFGRAWRGVAGGGRGLGGLPGIVGGGRVSSSLQSVLGGGGGGGAIARAVGGVRLPGGAGGGMGGGVLGGLGKFAGALGIAVAAVSAFAGAMNRKVAELGQLAPATMGQQRMAQIEELQFKIERAKTWDKAMAEWVQMKRDFSKHVGRPVRRVVDQVLAGGSQFVMRGVKGLVDPRQWVAPFNKSVTKEPDANDAFARSLRVDAGRFGDPAARRGGGTRVPNGAPLPYVRDLSGRAGGPVGAAHPAAPPAPPQPAPPKYAAPRPAPVQIDNHNTFSTEFQIRNEEAVQRSIEQFRGWLLQGLEASRDEVHRMVHHARGQVEARQVFERRRATTKTMAHQQYILYGAPKGGDVATLVADAQSSASKGFLFPYTRMRVREAPVMAPDGSTQVGTALAFEITGWIATASPEAMFVELSRMRAYCSQPRGRFLALWKTEPATWQKVWDVMYASDGFAADVANGPVPGELVTQTIGGRAIQYTWTLHAVVKHCFSGDCSPTNQRATSILSITRHYDYAVDADGMTTRTVSGQLTIAATGEGGNRGINGVNQTFDSSVTADRYRGEVVPTLPLNFLRVGQQFSQSEDGRTLTFSFTDRETVFTPPKDISRATATMTVTVAEMGLLTRWTLAGTFAGTPQVSKLVILQAILNLIGQKMPAPLGARFVYYPSHTIQEDLFESNAITFSVTAEAAIPPTDAVFGVPDFADGLTLSAFGERPQGSDGKGVFVGPYGGLVGAGSSGVQAGPVKFYDACIGTPNVSANTAPSVISGQYGVGRGDAAANERGEASWSSASADHQSAPYVEFCEVISFEVDNGFVTFSPKVEDAPEVVQQTRNPTCYVVQTGYACRVAKDASQGPRPPKPLGGTAGVTVLQAGVTPHNPTPIGDGTARRYKISWNYRMKVTGAGAFTDASLEDLAKWPADPRLVGDGTREAVQGLGAGDLGIVAGKKVS